MEEAKLWIKYEDVFDEASSNEKSEGEEPSLIRKIGNSSIVISLDRNEDLSVIKNRDSDFLKTDQGVKLISKIVSEVVINENKIFKLFKPTLEEEVFNSIFEVFKKWGVRCKQMEKYDFPSFMDEYMNIPDEKDR